MKDIIIETFPLGLHWPTIDPFLFCAHHLDIYPAATKEGGVAASHLQGRRIGNDFELHDGFRMYHGATVPGFPVHPHRGFETVTVVRQGIVDHADSLGAAGRYGNGDVQWMTAGGGIQHSEMFPLLSSSAPNPAELFQIWLNLPRASKMVEPHFKMFWSESIPKLELESGKIRVDLIAGRYQVNTGGNEHVHEALTPPPASWAARPKTLSQSLWFRSTQRVLSFFQVRLRRESDESLIFIRGAKSK